MNTILRHFALPALAAGALLSALPAHAVGRLVDINLIDRDSGESLPVYRHQGQYWVAGRPGARYAVSVRNALPGRIMGVVSVDGVNVVSGQTAAWHQTGYVLGPWQQYDISGWRKTDSEVAAFHFTALPSSYAARTGRPAHVGVIGVAVFREKLQVPALAPQTESLHPSRGGRRELGEGEVGVSSADTAAEAKRAAPAASTPRLGTGHGQREHDPVGHTQFERRSSQPDELINIRYDSRENLIAMGVLPPETLAHRPQPFPGSRSPRYVPDPD